LSKQKKKIHHQTHKIHHLHSRPSLTNPEKFKKKLNKHNNPHLHYFPLIIILSFCFDLTYDPFTGSGLEPALKFFSQSFFSTSFKHFFGLKFGVKAQPQSLIEPFKVFLDLKIVVI